MVKGLPQGGSGIHFRLTNKTVPDFNHGGNWVAMHKEGAIAPGIFTCFSPCPRGGSHVYEWTADARATKSGAILKRAKAVATHP